MTGMAAGAADCLDSLFQTADFYLALSGPGAGELNPVIADKLPAMEILQPDGSRITNFTYLSHRIYSGKPSFYTDETLLRFREKGLPWAPL